MESKGKPSPPLKIPKESLSKEALAGLIDAFILREGTDYGAVEASHESKVKKIQGQIDRGEVLIVFDPMSETAGLATKSDWETRQFR